MSSHRNTRQPHVETPAHQRFHSATAAATTSKSAIAAAASATAWDTPPIVISPKGAFSPSVSTWQARSTQFRTLRHLSSIVLLPQSPSSHAHDQPKSETLATMKETDNGSVSSSTNTGTSATYRRGSGASMTGMESLNSQIPNRPLHQPQGQVVEKGRISAAAAAAISVDGGIDNDKFTKYNAKENDGKKNNGTREEDQTLQVERANMNSQKQRSSQQRQTQNDQSNQSDDIAFVSESAHSSMDREKKLDDSTIGRKLQKEDTEVKRPNKKDTNITTPTQDDSSTMAKRLSFTANVTPATSTTGASNHQRVKTNISSVEREREKASMESIDYSSTLACAAGCTPLLIDNGKFVMIALEGGEIRMYDQSQLLRTFYPSLSSTVPQGSALSSSSAFSSSSSSASKGKHNAIDDEDMAPRVAAPLVITRTLASLVLESDAPLVQLLHLAPRADDQDKSGDTHDDIMNSGDFIAISNEGHVHHFCWTVTDGDNNEFGWEDTTKQTRHKSHALHLQKSWNTGECGATCVTYVRPDNDLHTDSLPVPQLLLGYSNGKLESWKFPANIGNSLKGDITTTQQQSFLRRKPSLLWKTLVDAFYAIEAVSALTVSTKERHEHMTQHDIHKKQSRGIESKVVLLLLLQQIGKDDWNSSHLKAFDLLEVQKKAKDFGKNISLKTWTTCEILPVPAMALVDPTSSTVNVIPNDVSDINQSSGVPFKMSLTKIPSRNSNLISGLAVAMTGHLAQLSITMDPTGEIRWGVQDETEEECFFRYPLIGLGQQIIRWRQKDYIVGCQRGGTCYMLPAKLPEATTIVLNDTCNIEVGMYPHDVISDITNVYVQSFAAGMLNDILPLLIFVFPGGVIETFTILDNSISAMECDGNVSSSSALSMSANEARLLEDLIHEGCLEKLIKLLEHLKDNSLITSDDLIFKEHQFIVDSALWKDAILDLEAGWNPKTVDDIIKLPNIRRLLLIMANYD